MKRPALFLTVLLIVLGTHLNAQQSSYQEDLEFLYHTLQQTPSYKDQITGDKKTRYRQLFERLEREPVPTTALDTFYSLSKLFWPIKDRHLAFYQDTYLTNNLKALNNPEFLKTYAASSEFKNYPRVNVNLDSLEKELSNKPKENVEGIYLLGDLGKIGIYRTARKDSLLGVVMSSYLKTWDRSQIFSVMIETKPNFYRTVFCNFLVKGFVFSESSRFIAGRMQYYDLKKEGVNSYADYHSDKPYIFKQIKPEVQYLYLGSFQASNQNMVVAKAFYNTIKDTLKAPRLIVDLRTNYGGANKCADQFYSLIKSYSKQHKVYVLINAFVYSMGERFALRLKSLKNTKLFGEDTNGKIAYGANIDNTLTLPSKRYKIYTTDMKDPANYLRYEEIGVKPDIYLNNDKDWLEQVLTYIDQH
ncbi:S41 family peptidase [Mucilaginibacter sp. UR6-11]|uniref:S41 family peptidase n=1 Tax=Mucilaginibacter sp. UR6-11 TaxID=1435644 RepID=UPI001E508ED5|nr:S41 family peptidase [Mucilaginibacter sp. UR6-11]MCC8424481.1 hypothetical protein [Mucilaginibacter sp. UR6-11]